MSFPSSITPNGIMSSGHDPASHTALLKAYNDITERYNVLKQELKQERKKSGSYNNSFSSTSSSVQSGVARSTSREQGLALDGAVMDGRSQDRTAAQENLAFLQLEVMNLQKEKERVTLQMKDVQENLKIMTHKFGTAVKENHKLKSEVRDLTSRLEKGNNGQYESVFKRLEEEKKLLHEGMLREKSLLRDEKLRHEMKEKELRERLQTLNAQHARAYGSVPTDSTTPMSGNAEALSIQGKSLNDVKERLAKKSVETEKLRKKIYKLEGSLTVVVEGFRILKEKNLPELQILRDITVKEANKIRESGQYDERYNMEGLSFEDSSEDLSYPSYELKTMENTQATPYEIAFAVTGHHSSSSRHTLTERQMSNQVFTTEPQRPTKDPQYAAQRPQKTMNESVSMTPTGYQNPSLTSNSTTETVDLQKSKSRTLPTRRSQLSIDEDSEFDMFSGMSSPPIPQRQNASSRVNQSPALKPDHMTLPMHIPPRPRSTNDRECPVCRETLDMDNNAFEKHVDDCCTESTTGGSTIQDVPQAKHQHVIRKCPVCDRQFVGDLTPESQAKYEEHVHGHFNDLPGGTGEADVTDSYVVPEMPEF